DARLDRREAGVEAHQLRRRPALVHRVGLAEDRQEAARQPRRGLDDVRQVALVLLLVEVLELRAAHLLMLAEVVVAAIRDAFELAEALRAGEREGVLHVGAAAGVLRVVRELVLLVVAEAEVLAGEPEALPPVEARLPPALVPL